MFENGAHAIFLSLAANVLKVCWAEGYLESHTTLLSNPACRIAIQSTSHGSNASETVHLVGLAIHRLWGSLHIARHLELLYPATAFEKSSKCCTFTPVDIYTVIETGGKQSCSLAGISVNCFARKGGFIHQGRAACSPPLAQCARQHASILVGGEGRIQAVPSLLQALRDWQVSGTFYLIVCAGWTHTRQVTLCAAFCARSNSGHCHCSLRFLLSVCLALPLKHLGSQI
jgi:hypothetical protein